MKTLLLIDRLATQAGVNNTHGKNATMDLRKLIALLGGQECETIVWDCRPSAGFARAVELSGGILETYSRTVSGEVEVAMAVEALCSEDSVRRIVFVSGSKALCPLLRELALDDELEVVVASYRLATAVDLLDIPGIVHLELDHYDVTREKGE